MRKPKKEAGASPKKADWLEFFRGKIVQITALVGAIVALVVGVQQGWQKIRPPPPSPEPVVTKIVTGGLQGPCVRIDEVKVPGAFVLSDWENVRISVTGRNDCERDLGLYITFAHRLSAEPPRLVLRKPQEGDYPECTGAGATVLPKCWDSEKPIPISQGRWHWDAPLPPYGPPLGELRQTEILRVSLDVRDVDAPDKAPLATKPVIIKIVNDTAAQ